MRALKGLLMAAALTAAPAMTTAAPIGPSNDSAWTVSKPRLGVMVMSLTPELRTHLGAANDRGVLVARVEAGSPAAGAGISVGDVIVDVQGRSVDDASDVLAVLADVDAGKKVAVHVVRNKQPLTLQVTLARTNQTEAAIGNPSWSHWLREMMKPFDLSPPRA
jgi:S1-C subfamily serine protease